MKLIYIVNARIPTEKAHGVQIMKMCEAFSAAGVDVVLVVPRRRNAIKADPFIFYGVAKPFEIVRLPIIDSYSWGRAGFVVGSLSFALSSFLYGLSVKGRASIEDGELVFYSRDQDQFSFASFFFALRPYFFEVHGLKEKGWLHRRLFRCISGAIATNSFIADALARLFPRLKSRMIILPNGVDLKAFEGLPDHEQACAKLGLDPTKKNIVYAGHFYAWKGVNALVKAAAKLPLEFQVHLVGGNAEDAARLKDECPEGAARVDFLGYQPFASMPLWYSAADALVITGTAKDRDSVHYTSPIKLFEYMASGRPIVAVDSPAVRDIVSDDDVFFYKPDDERSLASTVIQAASASPEASEKAASARRKAAGYAWSKRAEKILGFINEKA